jgi:hypothetical protein
MEESECVGLWVVPIGDNSVINNDFKLCVCLSQTWLHLCVFVCVCL